MIVSESTPVLFFLAGLHVKKESILANLIHKFRSEYNTKKTWCSAIRGIEKKPLQYFSKGKQFAAVFIGVSVKLMAYVLNALFCLSVLTWIKNGVGIKNSDLATFYDLTFFDVEAIIRVCSKELRNLALQYQVYLTVVTIDYVPVVVFVIFD